MAKACARRAWPLQYRHFESASHGFACSEGPTENFNDGDDRACRLAGAAGMSERARSAAL